MTTPTGGSPEHLLQDQSRELSRALAGKPDAPMHAREAATALREAAPTDSQLDALWADACKRDQPTRDMVRAFARAAIAAAQPVPDAPAEPLTDQGAAALALLKRIRYHAQRHSLPRDWLTAADEVLGTWEPVKLTHSEIAAAHPPQPAPAGWRLVPQTPTKEMQWAGCIALEHASVRDLDATLDEMAAAYRAMLAAAPAAPGGGAGPNA